MREYYYELPWPKLENMDFLIERINEYEDYLNHQDGYSKNIRYANLIGWPTREQDISNIIESLPVDNIMTEHTTVQRILPPGLSMHVDKNRAVSAMAVITGEAWTLFQNPNEKLHRVKFDIGKWYLFNNKAPHGVKGLKELRVGLCINFTNFYTYEEALYVYT